MVIDDTRGTLTIHPAKPDLVDGKEQCCQKSQEDWDALFGGEGREPAKELSRQRIRRRRIVAAKVLRGYAPKPGPADERRRGRWYPVTACNTVARHDGLSIDVRASGRCDVAGVLRCGSVWTCPDCAQRVATHRAAEICKVIEAARGGGYRVEMVTFTLPHDASLPADECMRRIKDSLRRFSSDGTGARALRAAGYLGQVRSIEVTHGHTNGWHFHAHAVLVFDQIDEGDAEAKADFARSLVLKKALYPVWVRAAQASGAGTPSFRHGFDVRVVWSANDYIAKMPEQAKAKDDAGKGRWGAEAELSKAYMKEGRKSSRTPWEILDTALDCQADAQLFRDYARATWGRTQIEWSKGERNLRRLFLDGVPDVADEALVYDEPEWAFEDEGDEELDKGQENIVVEQVQIAADDTWRARRANFGSIDRAILAVEREDVVSIADALRIEGWEVIMVSPLRRDTAVRDDRGGRTRECFVFEPAKYRAIWPH